MLEQSFNLKIQWYRAQQSHSNQSEQVVSTPLSCLGRRIHHFIVYFLPIRNQTSLLRPPKFSIYPLRMSQSSTKLIASLSMHLNKHSGYS